PLLALSSSAGQMSWPNLGDPLVAELRLPRVIAALGVGAALSASGAALQALFRNPLADPGLIGTSGGAALAVIAVLALGLSGLSLPLAAFGGGLAATWLILALARLAKGGLAGLLLMGLVGGAFCGAVSRLILFLSDDLALRAASSWLAGNLGASLPGSRWAGLLAAGLGVALL
ncbi:iron chelate uptake ABC transporter family permease subunit, partial [Pseudomonas sp. MWU12-2323]|uniref:iron chelate uptake ABC transporter family permease subunit n=1 Tax=Pseudomonas sp. MWU12-2323 TaxID=2651296 RepID=UPI00128C2210